MAAVPVITGSRRLERKSFAEKTTADGAAGTP